MRLCAEGRYAGVEKCMSEHRKVYAGAEKCMPK